MERVHKAALDAALQSFDSASFGVPGSSELEVTHLCMLLLFSAPICGVRIPSLSGIQFFKQPVSFRRGNFWIKPRCSMWRA